MDRRAKIVATIGPASGENHIIERMLRAGVNVVRLNFSHGSHEEYTKYIENIRRISADLNHPVTVLQDLQGPKIRTGPISAGEVTLNQGQSFALTTREMMGDEQGISVDFPDLPNNVRPGNRILLDDGNLECAVTTVTEDTVETQVVLGGVLKARKGVNLPGVRLNIRSLTEKDEADLAFGLSMELDAVAMSFVRSANDIVQIKQAIARINPERAETPVIAKLERPESLENLEEIIQAADGVMVARGDLGVEMSPEAVPLAQKHIIEAANQHAKVVITATQMLESMISNPRPTRAEATDVANAVFDGTDALMLSGETAVGKFPVQSVKMMDAIIRKAEVELSRWGHWEGKLGEAASGSASTDETTHDDALSITRAARELAHERNVTAVAVFTQTGRTAHLMAKARPGVQILAFTPVESTYRRLPMFWGVTPYLVPYANTLEDMLQVVEEAIIAVTSLQPGQQVVLISGFPVGALCPPNMALLHTIGKKHQA
jgi:pyruvate kinase